ncbi:MAG: phycobilisome rod-core linker polypeptide [Oscillatoriaceae bacterium SKW80]|nr:phycobilisome rod-core linker polypeptide [Oscillatoriaceae bacterium SKYG93]MCX8121308.1 phycobilisome rod-core linker polypeptide [Oscillatoriaceae bacterium SKW80]MDW8453358.1 phycobilisome rod-core linker polypeptide [Oscillatoriaceae cyanobacterium SKYGB_i_bin93]HIK26712.1 phycobilisome rod-core linker polypeptide [Oscillatoriaceae cyanobacterium M7585_C2015_266]
MLLKEPITTHHNASPEERKQILLQIYRQVLERVPYIAERRQIANLENEFIKGKIGIRHFLKRLAVTPLYLQSFYERSSNVKFIENAIKHFLGRAPHDEAEIRFYDNLLVRRGVGAMVSEMIDSEEYRKAFGCFTVPYWRKRHYESANDYLESSFLEKEYAGQRGWAIPTLYWHELHLDCSGGICRPAWLPSRRVRS